MSRIEPMRVAVLGAGGTIAPAIVRDLAESDEVASLLLLDIDEARAEQVASLCGGPKARAAFADARASADAPDSLARALEGCDVLVNSASYRVNLDAMTACLKAGCHYLDLGGLYWMTGRQLELGPRFESAGLLALLGIGSAPGKTNLMALRAVRELRGAADPAAPARPAEEAAGIDSVLVSAAGRDLDPPPGFSVPYALQTLLDELTLRPVVLRDGAPEEIEPLNAGGVVEFEEPIGAAETIHTLHSELRTFGDSFGCGEASFRLSLSPDLLSTLRELTEAPEAEIRRIAGEAVPPSGKTVSVHLVEASGGGRSVRVRAVTEPTDAWGLGGGVVSTAAPAAAAVRLLARERIEARGAAPPERCIEPAEMFSELEQRGCRFEVTTREEVRA
ncbi:MAG: saccharopine dehydrogenase NADP-binding domain-containing protein [Actinomycetota bacterium]